MLVDYESGSPPALPKGPDISPEDHRGTQPRKPTICPPFALKFKKYLILHSLSVRKSRGNTKAPQRILNFCPFSAYFSPFCPCCQVLRQSEGIKAGPRNGSPPPNKTRNTTGAAAPMVPELSASQERNKGTRERKKEPEQAGKPIKKGPPLLQGAGSLSPHHKFAPKNQQKVALGCFEKIFGKVFRWNVSGKEKPLALSQRKGVAQMKIVK